jgi:uncharacterized membrane protein
VEFQGALVTIAFLISAMWALWKLDQNMVAKLATVTGFVVGFALWLLFLTGVQKKEAFAAIAAYAAVLVVYVDKS